ncbi:MAG: hypothetical protein HW421_2038 [Ignavibacteria bacterium]|nr:hypothetical protein [Ignavibacteria bacterium]
MIIANPIYDVVFKRLMEDKKIAKFFVETLTGEIISEIELKPQEFTYNDRLAGIAVYRLDFLAKIKTSENEFKKVLIEIQKAKNAVDLMRFRNYLAEQYKKEDEITTDEGIERTALPIITIYLLGFRLSEIESSVLKVNRQYIDLITNKIINQKSEFIEKLTHDCYIVQIPRIQSRIQSKLEMLLTVFEQKNFIDDKEITKNYTYQIKNESIKDMVNILHHAGTDPDEKIELEKEQEALRVFDLGMKELKLTIAEKEKALTEKDKALKEKDKLIKELKDKLKEQ